MSSRGVPVGSFLFRRPSKISKWIWFRLLSNYCLCAGSQSLRDILQTFKKQSLFPIALNSPTLKLWLPLKLDILGASLPGIGPLGWNAQCGTQILHSLGKTSTIVIILPFYESPTQLCGFWLYHISASPTYPVLMLEIFSASLQIAPIDGCSVNSYNCDMSVGEKVEAQGFLTLLSWPHLQKQYFV